jgi:hypothetical protein
MRSSNVRANECYLVEQKQGDPEIKKTGINSFFLVLNHLYSNPIQESGKI